MAGIYFVINTKLGRKINSFWFSSANRLLGKYMLNQFSGFKSIPFFVFTIFVLTVEEVDEFKK